MSITIGFNIAVTGLDYAGKTTIIKRMILGRFIENQPATPSLNIELLEDKKTSSLFEVFDVSGQIRPRSLIWEPTVSQAEGCVFVIDSSDKKRLEEAKTWFWTVMKWTKEKPVVLVLINKIDLPEHMPGKEIIDVLDLNEIPEWSKDRLKIFEVSAKSGERIEESFGWFMEKVNLLKTPRDSS